MYYMHLCVLLCLARRLSNAFVTPLCKFLDSTERGVLVGSAMPRGVRWDYLSYLPYSQSFYLWEVRLPNKLWISVPLTLYQRIIANSAVANAVMAYPCVYWRVREYAKDKTTIWDVGKWGMSYQIFLGGVLWYALNFASLISFTDIWCAFTLFLCRFSQA